MSWEPHEQNAPFFVVRTPMSNEWEAIECMVMKPGYGWGKKGLEK